MNSIIVSENCSNCKHSFSPQRGQWQCRLNPPLSFPVPAPNGQIGFMTVFPVVNADMKCGQHKRGVADIELPMRRAALG